MSTIVAQTLSNGTVSTSTANCIQGSAKAWVNFNGSGGAIRGSYNTSSITVVTTGTYTMNFTNAMPNANYAVSATAGDTSSTQFDRFVTPYSTLTTSVSITVRDGGSGLANNPFVSITVNGA